jgi:hypothetical protein
MKACPRVCSFPLCTFVFVVDEDCLNQKGHKGTLRNASQF